MISVIVPVYNRAATVRTAAESVFAQTYQDFELILVDDGSCDNSLSVCNAIAKEHPEHTVRVFGIEHGGVSRARNFGIDHAKGDWITFLDSDDEYHPLFLEHMLDAAITNGAQWVYCARIATFDDLPGMKWYIHPFTENKLYTKADLEELENNILFSPGGSKLFSTCTCIYSAELFRRYDLRYSEAIDYGEDLLLNYEIAHHIDAFYYHNEPLYIYHVAATDVLKEKQNMPYEDIKNKVDEYECTRTRVGSQITPSYLLQIANIATLPLRQEVLAFRSQYSRDERQTEYERFEQLISEDPVAPLWNQLTKKSFSSFEHNTEKLNEIKLIWKKHYELTRHYIFFCTVRTWVKRKCKNIYNRGLTVARRLRGQNEAS